jgi:carboxyl-terminal processing protease
MQGSTSRLRALALLLAVTASWLSPSPGQVRIPPEALAGAAELEQLFENGAQLERERRWHEAVSHYEEALRNHPGRDDLAERARLARIHLDVARRYADPGFLASLAQTDEQRALDVYSEVLLKIDTHYVQTPNWREVVQNGSTHVKVALTEPSFLRRNALDIPRERVEAFRRRLAQQVDSRVVHSRHEAREAVAAAAWVAADQLSAPPGAVVLEYTCGAVAALDEYSSFLTSSQLEDVFAQIEGNFVGLGVELKSDAQTLLIVNVISGGPAHQTGIREGDRIVGVDGRSTRDVSTDAAADMLKGPEGSTVELDVVTKDGARRKFQLLRRRVEVPSVEDARIIDRKSGVAYLRLTSFQKTTSRDVNAALWELHGEGMESLIVDVRDNPGGLLSAAVEVADKFVSGGAIVATRGRNSHEDHDYRAHPVGTWRVPLVVLIDADTASASEIFASAIRDHRRGLLVGRRSYGKGSVQGIFPLNLAEAGVRLTTARFYSPSGRPISRHGVSPDVVVRTAAKPTGQPVGRDDEWDDVALQAALQVARDRP